MQPISDKFLPDSEQFLPHSLPIALSAASQPSMQLEVLLGATDLEALNYNGTYLSNLVKVRTYIFTLILYII